MKRMISLLAVMAVMAAIVVASAMPAFAAPGGPGPNSVEPADKGGPTESANFGTCQSFFAKFPGSANNTAEVFNPSFGNPEQDGGTKTQSTLCGRR